MPINASHKENYNLVVDGRSSEDDPCVCEAQSSESSYCEYQPTLSRSSSKNSPETLCFAEDSSLFSSCYCDSDQSACLDVSTSTSKSVSKRNISFDDRIQIREFAVTVGDHPCCMGGLPLSLDWYHTEEPLFRSMEECCAERTGPYVSPQRLNYEARKLRLFQVSSYSEQRVRSEEVNVVMKFLECSWAQHTLLPLPKFDDFSEDSEDCNEEDDKFDFTHPSPEQVFRWTRVMRRSQSFLE
jgi:hypothetical protein